jgi:hypothetical protein
MRDGSDPIPVWIVVGAPRPAPTCGEPSACSAKWSPTDAAVVTLLADSGDRYAATYFCDEWLKTQVLDTSAPATALTEFEPSGHWD